MKIKRTHCAVLLAILLVAAFLCMFLADGIQRDRGQVEITEGVIETELGDLTYKLYRPTGATAQNPAPGVLLLHGYQNDHETSAAYAIELSRRGVVVLALDEYGHGNSTVGLVHRGYVNHRVTVNFGEENEADGSYVSIGGTVRYRIMMNFSNLSFFDPYYSTDADGNAMTDTSAGGIAAYAVLADMDFVDSSRLGISGHSMGTWSSWTVAAAYSGTEIEPKATVLQCGELFRDSVYDTQTIHFNNVLLLQAKYDEFSYFRDYDNLVDDALLHSDLRAEFLGCSPADAAWDTTYGDFATGTARRMELLYTNHRLTTHDGHGLTAAMDWFGSALALNTTLATSNHVAFGKELLTLAATLLTLAAMFPLMELLLSTPLFRYVAQPLPDQAGIKATGAWWRIALISILLAGASFPFMTQLGHALLPLPENIFRMTVGNGFVSWYGLLILIMLGTTVVGRMMAKKRGGAVASLYDMGLSGAGKPNALDGKLLGLSALLVGIMIGMVYVMTMLCTALFHLDLRFIWPMFRPFTGIRLVQFCVYILIFALFYILNNSKIMAGLRTKEAYRPGVAGFLGSWCSNFLVMAGGLVLITLLEYIPFFMGIGPGADILFGSTFGGPFMSLLILFVPQVLVFSLICTYCYRRTGNVYPGALTAAALACWIVTGGSTFL